jgi:hypothetical protein
MHRIASPLDLSKELSALLDYSQTRSPSRQRIATSLRDIAERVEPRVAASYNWEGEAVPLNKLIPKAEAKDVVMMNGKPVYHLVMKNKDGGDATVFTIPKKDWEKAKVKDQTTPKVKAELTEREIKELAGKLSMSDKVDFNTWAKKEKPSDEKKLEWLKKR